MFYSCSVPGVEFVDRCQSFPNSRQSHGQSVLQPVVRMLTCLIQIWIHIFFKYKNSEILSDDVHKYAQWETESSRASFINLM